MTITPAFLDQLRDKLSLYEVVGRRVQWDRKKSNPRRRDWWACCPFHHEKTPSFHIEERDIEARAADNADGISDQDILGVLGKMIKQRNESARQYEEGGRLELAERERAEIEIIKDYLPEQMSADEMAAAIASAVEGGEASGLKDMGRVMAVLKEKHAGQMDFSKASVLVKERLS